MQRRASDTVFRQAQNRSELEAALRLVHDSYVHESLMEQQQSGMYITSYNALPTAVTCVALDDDVVVVTSTLFFDSDIGLPLDAFYHDEVASLRERGRKIGEASMLSHSFSSLRHAVSALLGLMRLISTAAQLAELDDLFAIVHPRYAAFYERALRFHQAGSVKEYTHLHNAPAVLLQISKDALNLQADPAELGHEVLFSLATLPEETSGYRMSREDLAYFFVEQTDVFNRFSEAQCVVVESYYPGLDIRELLSA